LGGEVAVIPVVPQDEPRPPEFDFDLKVRKPGENWLQRQGIALSRPLPLRTDVPDYWRECSDVLYRKYNRVCAYLAVYVRIKRRGATVDHFLPKTKFPKLIFEWSNYRLACLDMNGNKGDCCTVLDPFTLAPGTFRLRLPTGEIYVNPDLPVESRAEAQATIEQLQLDLACYREMRATDYHDYVKQCQAGEAAGEEARRQLMKYSPFVCQEVERQERSGRTDSQTTQQPRSDHH